jgi:guanosine-3',5'-bis(diphosphate) 3'-pyrophosphohydrolase
MDTNLILKAITFAAEKHKYQRRKGFNQVPYINHPLKVCKLLSDCGEEDEILLVGAILHDVIEDTDSTTDEIIKEFGEDTCKLVLEVTDDKEVSKSERKEFQINNAPLSSLNARKLKIADKICNMRDIISYPLDWSMERKLNYLKWAKKVFDACGNVNPLLEKIFTNTYNEGIELLGEGLVEMHKT